MLQKIIDFFNTTFGSAGKWVLLGVVCLIIAIGVTLITLVVINIKWVIIGGGILAVLAIAGFIVYQKFIKKV